MATKFTTEVSRTRNLFSKLQILNFTSFVTKTAEEKTYLDVESQEILMRMRSNIEKLSDASSRIEFMMGELSQIMKKGI